MADDAPFQIDLGRVMILEYDGYDHVYYDGDAGISHQVQTPIDPTKDEISDQQAIKVTMWVTDPDENGEPTKRELIIWLTDDDATKLANSLLSDVCLLRYGAG